MVRIAKSKERLTSGAVSYIVRELNNALHDFIEELDRESKLKATYVSSRDAAAKAHAVNSIRMIRWLYETEFGLTAPAPYTDGDVDGINIDIRTFEDGL